MFNKLTSVFHISGSGDLAAGLRLRRVDRGPGGFPRKKVINQLIGDVVI
jgi:hypothetical protein